MLPGMAGNAATASSFKSVASNSSSDLRRREADIAFRGGELTRPDLIAEKGWRFNEPLLCLT